MATIQLLKSNQLNLNYPSNLSCKLEFEGYAELIYSLYPQVGYSIKEHQDITPDIITFESSQGVYNLISDLCEAIVKTLKDESSEVDVLEIVNTLDLLNEIKKQILIKGIYR